MSIDRVGGGVGTGSTSLASPTLCAHVAAATRVWVHVRLSATNASHCSSKVPHRQMTCDNRSHDRRTRTLRWWWSVETVLAAAGAACMHGARMTYVYIREC